VLALDWKETTFWGWFMADPDWAKAALLAKKAKAARAERAGKVRRVVFMIFLRIKLNGGAHDPRQLASIHGIA
jgi:hypothetical protein